MNKLLTIGMATYDDYDGTYFSTQALTLYHEILKSINYEILIIDNNPDSEHGKAVKNLPNWMNGNGRYIEYRDKVSTSVRNEIFKNASGKYTISMDCHVLLAPKSIEALLNYYFKNPDCKDIIQGPMLYDDHKNYSTQFDPVWRGDMYGVWGTNAHAYDIGEPFEIPMMGLGVFSCETKNWLGFNEHFRGFGGEEGYIHEKFRKNGGKAICLPKFKWTHRFNRPNGVKYRLVLEDRIWNYFIGWLELTQDPDHQMIKDIKENFKKRIPESSLNNIFEQAKNLIFNNGENHADS
jgi:hypothetical protein